MAISDALALKLTALVVPNWPFVQGTDISVLDIVDCVKRGTPEQRQVGKDVREAMGKIMELDEDAPVRLLLEGFCRPVERTTLHRQPGSEEAGQARQLPNELMLRVLHTLLPDDDWSKDIEVACLGRLRGVSRGMKDLVETLFPNTMHRYVAHVVRSLLHKVCLGKPKLLSILAHSSASLFGRCKELRVWMAGDEIDGLNSLLPVFGAMEKLTVFLTYEDTALTGVDLRVCPRLRCMQVEGIDLREEATTWEYAQDRLNISDTYVDKIVNERALRFNQRRFGWVRPGPVRLVAAFGGLTLDAAFRSFKGLNNVTLLHLVEPAHLIALGLEQPRGPSTIHFGGAVGEEAIAVLALANKLHLRTLTFGTQSLRSSNGNSVFDPIFFSLRENQSLVHLALPYARLQSANFGLDVNNHLRYLDLDHCFREVGGLATALRELGAQLAENTTLEVLLLGVNDITDEAVQALRLGDNKGLRKLSLSFNSLSDAGLGTALEGNTTLEMVDVCGNPVTVACAEELSSSGRRIIHQQDDMSWWEDATSVELQTAKEKHFWSF